MTPAEYREYLHSEHWQARRQQALADHGHRCQACGSANHLHVHHRSYAHLGAERADDLRVLCHNCHQLVHDTQHRRPMRLQSATDTVVAQTPRPPTGDPAALADVVPIVLAHSDIRRRNAGLDESVARHPSGTLDL